MLIDGEKWACEACVRGHRVSSCRHHDRPLIRINKKGRPFSVCCICRGPCTDREEHSKLNRDKKSDGESDSKFSGKNHKAAARRRIHPSSFARIAPHPATSLPSTNEQFISTSQSTRRPTTQSATAQRYSPPLLPSTASSRSRSRSMTTRPPPTTSFEMSTTHMAATAAPVVSAPLGYPYVTLPTMEEPLLQPAHPFPSPYPDDIMFGSLSDSSFVPDSMYSGFEDVDALPEDWSTFFWSE